MYMILGMSLHESKIQAWNVSKNQFPKEGAKTEQLKFLLNYAILAPSGHNTQPWLFKIVGDNMIELYADRTRALAVVDPEDRELTISCGAALSHLLIAIRHFGYAYKVEPFPDSNNKDLLSRVILYDRKEPVSEENSLFKAITKRRTNRLKFEDRELEESLISKLRSVITDIEGRVEVEEETPTVWLILQKKKAKRIL